MGRTLILVGAMALLSVLFVPPAGAVDQYVISHLTFSAPVRVPGATLPAGTYTFKRVLPGVIQVLSKDRMTLYATFMTMPRSRVEPIEKDVVVFGEVPAGVPPPIETWFPFLAMTWYQPHRTIGYGFIYPE